MFQIRGYILTLREWSVTVLHMGGRSLFHHQKTAVLTCAILYHIVFLLHPYHHSEGSEELLVRLLIQNVDSIYVQVAFASKHVAW
jgi:hypothetical protein